MRLNHKGRSLLRRTFSGHHAIEFRRFRRMFLSSLMRRDLPVMMSLATDTPFNFGAMSHKVHGLAGGTGGGLLLHDRQIATRTASGAPRSHRQIAPELVVTPIYRQSNSVKLPIGARLKTPPGSDPPDNPVGFLGLNLHLQFPKI